MKITTVNRVNFAFMLTVNYDTNTDVIENSVNNSNYILFSLNNVHLFIEDI